MEIKREIHLKRLIESKHNGMIKIVTGTRRCGKSYLLYLFFFLAFAVSCSTDKQSHNELLCLDVKKSYPEKEINLSDIADISYLHLNENSDDFVYKGGINYVTKNTIVVVDRPSSSILFFSKDGNPKFRFNRKGQGPEEYPYAGAVIYDEAADDVYVAPDFSGSYINVYSSSGTFKRKLTLPQGKFAHQMFFFDDASILVHDIGQTFRKRGDAGHGKALSEQVPDSSFFLISRTDGTVLEYIRMKSNHIDLSFGGDGFVAVPGFAHIRKCPDGFFLFNPETDTVFIYNKDKTLTPFMHKMPMLSDLSPMVVMDICMDAGRFQFMSAYQYQETGSPEAKYYMRDKQTGEIFRQKITLPDYKGKVFYMDPRNVAYAEKEYQIELNLIELKEAYSENKLSGKLKELVSTLNEDKDNNVFMFVHFK